METMTQGDVLFLVNLKFSIRHLWVGLTFVVVAIHTKGGVMLELASGGTAQRMLDSSSVVTEKVSVT